MKKKIITLSLLAYACVANAQWNTNANSGIYNSNTGNVGIGTTLPGEKLAVVGNIRFSGTLMPNGIAGTAGQVLMSNGSGAPSWSSIGGTLSGGITNYLAKWNTSTTLAGSSLLYDDGTTVGCSGQFRVNGKLSVNCAPGSLGDISVMGVGTAGASIYVANSGTAESAIKVGNGLLSYKFFIESGNNYVGRIGNGSVSFLSFKQGSIPQLWVGTSAPIGTHSDFNFAVSGKMVAQSVYITPGTAANWAWADYVFAPDYKLPQLSDVESYYKANKHLPEIPTAAEVDEAGIDVAKINALLLKKVEELTLYVVEQQKQIDDQQGKIEAFEKKQKK